MATTTLLMVSSGKTAAETAERGGFYIAGRLDWPLTRGGENEAYMNLFRPLCEMRGNVAALYSGPLQRDQQTANIVTLATGLPSKTVPDLIGPDFGEVEGLEFFDVVGGRYPEFVWKVAQGIPLDTQFPGGELVADFHARIKQALDVIAGKWHPGKTVILVVHNWIIHSAKAHFAGGSFGKPPSL